MAVKIRRSYKGAATSAVLDSAGITSATQTAITLTTSPTNWPTGKFFVVVAPGTAQEEKMCVTLSGSTLTVVDPNNTSTSADVDGRGVDDTTARTVIAGGSTVYPVFTATDANEANELTSTYANQGGIVYQGASTFSQLSIGTAGHVLKVNSAATAPEWGQVNTTGIADDAITLDKLADAIVNKLVPVGTINAYAGATAPTGWLLCDGTSTSGYAALAALVGPTTPDLRGHVLVGKGSAPFDGALFSKFGSTTSTAAHTHVSGTLATASAGSHDHTYSGNTNAETQDHSHPQTVVGKTAAPDGATVIVVSGAGGSPDSNYSTGGKSTTHNHSYSGTVASSGSHTHTITGSTGASSAGTDHGNVQPSALVNFIIKHD